MDSLDLSLIEQDLEQRFYIETKLDHRSFWGVKVNRDYEKGWSSRLDRDTPALLSDASIWYFETELETVDAAIDPESPQETAAAIPKFVAI